MLKGHKYDMFDCRFHRYAFDHGPFNEANMYIPVLFMGPKVKKGHHITNYTTVKDFAPTALNALGLQPGRYMDGNVVEEIYVPMNIDGEYPHNYCHKDCVES